MRKAALIQACEEVIKSFNPKRVTLDSHANEVLGDCESSEADAEKVFIKQVFYGCVRNKPALKAFMSHFYNDMAASVLRADYTLYLILAYLTIFRLEELSFTEYRKFLDSQEPDKVNAFLLYTFDVPRLANSVKWDWLKIFDLEYVEDHMLRPISESAVNAESLRLEILSKASGLAAEKDAPAEMAGAKRQLTIPVSPRLTRPAPRIVPAPDKISQEVKATEMPRYLDRTNVEQIILEKEARRAAELEKTLKKYSESKVQPFELHETRNTIDKARLAAEQKLAAELLFDSKPGPAVPLRLPTKKAEFRMNTAAYLREDALYTKKQAEEAKLIEAYESELRDSTQFYQWQTSMKEQDVKDRLEQVERVRSLAKLSAAEAQAAMEQQRQDNASVAERIKIESEEMQKQLQYETEMQRVMNQELVHEMIQVREHAPREAQARMFEQRKERRSAVHDEMTALLAEREAEAEREHEERLERAKQLKALNEVHPVPVKVFDPTESIGLGLLGEMSLVEMKERLAINKVRESEVENSRRSDILTSKQKHNLNLRKRIENIERIRAAASHANKAAREKKVSKQLAEEQQREQEHNVANLRLLGELEAQRDAEASKRKALREEEERRVAAQAFGGQGAHAAEEHHFAELLKGAEREARMRQGEARRAAHSYEATKKQAKAYVDRDVKRDEAAKVRFYAAHAEEIKRKGIELAEKEKAEAEAKKAAFLNQREKSRMVKDKIIAMNPYANIITEASKSKREKQMAAQMPSR